MRIPMFIDIRDYKVLILGGGVEGTKKAKRFLKYGAKVTVYSLWFSEELRELSSKGLVKLIEGDVRNLDYVKKLIEDSDIIVYTVPELPDVEDAIIRTCKSIKKLYIISTNANRTQIAMPVETEVAGLRIAVTSEGKSTLVAKYVLNEIKRLLDDRKDIEVMLEAMGYAKEYMKSIGIHYKDRMKLYHRIFNDEKFKELVKSGDLEKTINYVKELIMSHSKV